MEKIYNVDKSRNNRTNMILKNISSHTSESYFENNYFLNHNKNYFNNKEQNSLNISTDKIMNGSTINNNDINYRRDCIFINKKSKTNNNFYKNSIYTKSNNILDNYIARLKNFGFPEIGEIFLSSDTREQEKTFNFFDYIIAKEANNIEKNHKKNKECNEYKDKCEKLEYKLMNMNKELINANKINKNIQKDLEHKIKKQKEFYEQKIFLLNKDNGYLTYVNNNIYFKKKNLELKLYSMNKTINKFEDMKSNIINAVEEIDYVQSNDMAKMLSRVKGAEKLIEALKGGYNESLRQLTLEISSFKNLIFEIHNEICVLLDNPLTIEDNIYEMPYSDAIEYYKKIFKNNIGMLKEKIQIIGLTIRQESII